jgi:transcriptional regulator with XRE-family HTH domain
MFVRVHRQRMRLSQEQLAESSGLSLRTVQRVEAGHRVSYASLRALADVFDVDVDKLELELYAMDKTGSEYKEQPLWVRLLLGRVWFSSSRREIYRTEIFLIVLGSFFGLVWAANLFWPLIYDPKGAVLSVSLLMFLLAYLTSICIRVGDKYAAWPMLGHSKPRKFFGISEKN